MWLFKQARSDYQQLPTVDSDVKRKDKQELKPIKPPFLHRNIVTVHITIVLIIGFVAILFLFHGKLLQDGSSRTSLTCTDPVVRREWRQLEDIEKQQYINAVRCLYDQPSKLHPEGRLTDDFPWVHIQTSGYTHNTATFPIWHRYFIHVYETELRQTCGYQGNLAYWDWSLDWENLAAAPIWDDFGGDGAPNAPITVRGGSCLEDGPFVDYEARYKNLNVDPHCLSRGFGRWLDAQQNPRYKAEKLARAAVEEIESSENLLAFALALEVGPHDQIPAFIGGDFLTFTAPSDPVFFLHHTQIDRLLWNWQKQDPTGARFERYDDYWEENSTIHVTLNDPLPMHGLAEDLMVQDILSTESDILCYRY